MDKDLLMHWASRSLAKKHRDVASYDLPERLDGSPLALPEPTLWSKLPKADPAKMLSIGNGRNECVQVFDEGEQIIYPTLH